MTPLGIDDGGRDLQGDDNGRGLQEAVDGDISPKKADLEVASEGRSPLEDGVEASHGDRDYKEVGLGVGSKGRTPQVDGLEVRF